VDARGNLSSRLRGDPEGVPTISLKRERAADALLDFLGKSDMLGGAFVETATTQPNPDAETLRPSTRRPPRVRMKDGAIVARRRQFRPDLVTGWKRAAEAE